MWSELTWFMWSDFVLTWSELRRNSWGQSSGYVRMTLHWGVLDCIVTISFGTVVVWTCFLVCGLVYKGVFWQLCGCFGNMGTRIYWVLCCFYCFFVLFRLCIFILTCFVSNRVRTTFTEWKLNYSSNSNNNNNNNSYCYAHFHYSYMYSDMHVFHSHSLGHCCCCFRYSLTYIFLG
jgi:hypothetical protein